MLIDVPRSFLTSIGHTLNARTVLYGPGKLCFYDMSNTQQDVRSVTIDAETKPEAVETYPVTGERRRTFKEPMNNLEKGRSCQPTRCLIGLTQLHHYRAHITHPIFNKKILSTNVDALIFQINKFKLLKTYAPLATTLLLRWKPRLQFLLFQLQVTVLIEGSTAI